MPTSAEIAATRWEPRSFEHIAVEQVQHCSRLIDRFIQWQSRDLLQAEPSPQIQEDHKQGLKWLLRLTRLICVAASEICCIAHEVLLNLIALRRQEKGSGEDAYTIVVTALPRNRFRVYVNAPGKRKKKIGERIVPRDDFPKVVFQNP